MAGTPKPLTEKQEELFNAYEARRKGEGRKLTDNQLADWGELYKKKHAKCKLTKGAKTFLEGLVFEELTRRSEKINSKYIEKGLAAEEKSLTLYSNYREALIIKNKERKTNDYFTGEADIARYKIRDIKTSWSWKTFPLRVNEIPNPMYEWQLDVYMDLWRLKRSELIYCLVDTPEKLIHDELRRLNWQQNIFQGDGNIFESKIDLVVETICNLIFTEKALEKFCNNSSSIYLKWFEGKFKEIPEEIRIKIFKHNYCKKRNQQLKETVVLARQYMNEVLEGIGGNALMLQQIEKGKNEN
jgi:hypothetical protein